MSEDWIAIVGIVCAFGLPVAGFVIIRVLAHRERMAMLQRGIIPARGGFGRGAAGQWGAPPPQYGAPPPDWNAQMPPWGAPPPYAYEDPNSPQCLLRKGITTSAVGIALLIGLSFIGYHAGDGLLQPPTFHPGPWLLGGLIPTAVGLAQIAIAVLSGAQFGTSRMTMPGPNPTPPPGSPPPPYSGNGAPPQPGRPGPRYEELARPVPPPDRT